MGFPGETEDDHDELLGFLRAAASTGPGSSRSRWRTAPPAAALDGHIDAGLAAERLRECTAVQEPITDAARDALIGETVAVLVDERDPDGGIVGRTHREAPEIDGVVRIPDAQARPGAVVPAA